MVTPELTGLKATFTESLHPDIDRLLPVVAQFSQEPPYTEDALDLFVATATKDAATGWLFLELVSNLWAQIKPLETREIDLFVRSWGKVDTPILLIKTIAGSLFNLKADMEMGDFQAKESKAILAQATDIVRRVVQPPAPDSIAGSIELKAELRRVKLDSSAW